MSKQTNLMIALYQRYDNVMKYLKKNKKLNKKLIDTLKQRAHKQNCLFATNVSMCINSNDIGKKIEIVPQDIFNERIKKMGHLNDHYVVDCSYINHISQCALDL